jgi:hypothetical protein
MGRLSWLGAGLAILAAACGQETGPVDASQSDLVPADGAEPQADAAGPSTVSVVVELPADRALAGMAIVTLEDVSYADVPASELGRVELPVDELLDQGAMVEIFLPIPLDGSIDVNAAVHIDVDEDGAVSQGDWVSPDLVLVTAFTGSTVSVPIIQV